jgi:hypothetical protein
MNVSTTLLAAHMRKSRKQQEQRVIDHGIANANGAADPIIDNALRVNLMGQHPIGKPMMKIVSASIAIAFDDGAL